ncbi:hypothetical protein TL16_g06226 [Triparma laevis f. inornata]|uniref:Uncharacterized protein n=1 Tax=Triparma laevis f. inornata TaxID=1714386 RepID=A0A9W7AKV0_9STRA|nr:hypothetical protein TL16_g06226 [Triparma laevis f. inornata]
MIRSLLALALLASTSAFLPPVAVPSAGKTSLDAMEMKDQVGVLPPMGEIYEESESNEEPASLRHTKF